MIVTEQGAGEREVESAVGGRVSQVSLRRRHLGVDTTLSLLGCLPPAPIRAGPQRSVSVNGCMDHILELLFFFLPSFLQVLCLRFKSGIIC